MALRFVDSFDHYSAAQWLRRYSSGSGIVIEAGGRRGTNGVRVNHLCSFGKVLDAQATWIVGFAYNFGGAMFTGPATLWAWQDAGTPQCDLRLNTNLTLSVTRNGTVLGTSVAILSAGNSYIEFKATIGNAGSYEVRVNGVNILSGAGVDTQNTANAAADRFVVDGFGITAAGGQCYDDLYVCDGTGSSNNNFLGDVRIDAKFPTGAGNSTQFTPSAGSNFQCVDDNPPNDDIDHVESANVGDKDTYAFGTLVSHTPLSIFGVQVNMHAKKDDAGARSIASVVRSGGSDTDGAAQPLGTTYANLRQMVEQDPNTAAPWTKVNLNASEFGPKVAA